MEFQDYLKKNAQKIEEELHKILSEFVDETKKISPELLPFAKAFVNSCQGGKRIRGVLCKLGYELAISKTPGVSLSTPGVSASEILKVGAALEILHAAILIHDDIIDQSPTRRDQPSLYQVLGGDHFGQSQAIVLGDIGLYLPVKVITDSHFDGEYKLKALNHLAQTIITTGWGQVLDVAKDKDKMLLYKLKTAHYTIAGPLQIGAMLAGASESLVKKLGEFGENLGIAFQIKDDILDKESSLVNQDLKKAVQYAFVAKKMIPGIIQDKVMSKLLASMTEYLVERTK